MNLWYSFKTALRALSVNKGRTGLTALGVIIGVSAVIIMVGLGQGLGNAITSEINATGANWIYVLPGRDQFGPNARLSQGKLTLDDVEALERQYKSTIVKVVPVAAGQTIVKYRNKILSVPFAGGTTDYLQVENMSVGKGSFFNNADIDGRVKVVVLGSTVVKELTGSEATDMVGRTVLINRQSFKVKGILRRKGVTFGVDPDKIILMPYTTAMRRMLNTDNLTYAAVQAAGKDVVDRVEEQIKRTLRQRHNIRKPYSENDDFSVMTQESVLQSVGQVTVIISLLLGSIAAISLLVGGIGIMNIMLVSVTERTREIGLRKAVGATTRDILLQFMIEAVVISILGGMIGIGIGLLGSLAAKAAINAFTSVKIVSVFSLSAVLLAFLVSAAIGIIAGIYPALRAARLDPIVALRYE